MSGLRTARAEWALSGCTAELRRVAETPAAATLEWTGKRRSHGEASTTDNNMGRKGKSIKRDLGNVSGMAAKVARRDSVAYHTNHLVVLSDNDVLDEVGAIREWTTPETDGSGDQDSPCTGVESLIFLSRDGGARTIDERGHSSSLKFVLDGNKTGGIMAGVEGDVLSHLLKETQVEEEVITG